MIILYLVLAALALCALMILGLLTYTTSSLVGSLREGDRGDAALYGVYTVGLTVTLLLMAVLALMVGADAGLWRL